MCKFPNECFYAMQNTESQNAIPPLPSLHKNIITIEMIINGGKNRNLMCGGSPHPEIIHYRINLMFSFSLTSRFTSKGLLKELK